MVRGEYDICFRGLTLREAWRFSGGPFQFVLALLLKAAAFKSGRVWLPSHECEAPCAEADLSPEARQDLLPVVNAARALGYTDGAFARAVRILDPNMLQGFSYLALHRDHQRGLFIGFVLNSAAGTTRRIVALTGALVAADGTNHEFLNHRQHFDSGGLTRKHQLPSCERRSEHRLILADRKSPVGRRYRRDPEGGAAAGVQAAGASSVARSFMR